MSRRGPRSGNSVSGRSVLITGASRGLGAAAVREMQRRGWHVLAAMRRPEDDVSDSGDAASPTAVPVDRYALDLLDPASVESTAKAILSSGTVPDVVIHNAGVAPACAIEDFPQSEWEKTFQTNVFGPMQLTRLLLPAMRERGSGRIVAVSSMAARTGMPVSGAYGASKAALERAMETLSFELAAFGLSAHVVEAGSFDTEILQGSSPDVDSAYSAMYQGLGRLASRVRDNAKPPAEFASALADYVSEPRPAVLKPLGRDASTLYLSHKLMPARVFRAATRRALGF